MTRAGMAPLDEKQAEMTWEEANQSYLILQFVRLRHRLGLDEAEPPREAVQQLRSSMHRPPAIDILVTLFELSSFERALLLLCAGIEMDSGVAAACREAIGGSQRNCITFGL